MGEYFNETAFSTGLSAGADWAKSREAVRKSREGMGLLETKKLEAEITAQEMENTKKKRAAQIADEIRTALASGKDRSAVMKQYGFEPEVADAWYKMNLGANAMTPQQRLALEEAKLQNRVIVDPFTNQPTFTGATPQALEALGRAQRPATQKPTVAPTPRPLDAETAQKIYQAAGGNKKKAEEMARKMGYQF